MRETSTAPESEASEKRYFRFDVSSKDVKLFFEEMAVVSAVASNDWNDPVCLHESLSPALERLVERGVLKGVVRVVEVGK